MSFFSLADFNNEVKVPEEQPERPDFNNPDVHDIELTPEGLAPWSVSKIKSLQKCPLQFYLKYVEKLKVEVEETEDRMRMHIGSATHEILEQVLKGIPADKAFARVRQGFKKKIPKTVWDDEVVPKKDNIEGFKSRIDSFSVENPIKEVLTEQKMAVDKNWNPVRFFDNQNAYFRGVIDLIIILENGDALITDHKTGGSTDFGLNPYRFQLDSYKPLVHYSKEAINNAQANIHFVNEGSILQGTISDNEDIQTRIPKEIQFNIETAVDNVRDLGYFKYKRNNLCKYCDFQEMCWAGPNRTSGELQEFEKASKEAVNNWMNKAS